VPGFFLSLGRGGFRALTPVLVSCNALRADALSYPAAF
jgi:hypothetical protein